MTKKELWEKYKTKKDWYDEYCNCDICSNKVSYEIKIGDYYICEECFVGKPLKCVMCGDEINEEDVWCNECLGVDDDY